MKEKKSRKKVQRKTTKNSLSAQDIASLVQESLSEDFKVRDFVQNEDGKVDIYVEYAGVYEDWCTEAIEKMAKKLKLKVQEEMDSDFFGQKWWHLTAEGSAEESPSGKTKKSKKQSSAAKEAKVIVKLIREFIQKHGTAAFVDEIRNALRD